MAELDSVKKAQDWIYNNAGAGGCEEAAADIMKNLLEDRDRLRAALEGIRGLFVTDRWWTGNRARYVVQLIDAALEGSDG